MKKIKNVILITALLLSATSCSNIEENLGTEPLKNHPKTIFTIEIGSKDCVPVQLAVYEEGKYELFTAYETCRPNEACTDMLKYTRTLKGNYEYDVSKIIENSVDAQDKTYSMDNLPEYEIYVGEEHHYYTIEKGQTNQYLNEFLKQLNIDLDTCAKKDFKD